MLKWNFLQSFIFRILSISLQTVVGFYKWRLCFQRREIRRCWTRYTFLSSVRRSAASADGTAVNWRTTWSVLGIQKVVVTHVRVTLGVRSCVERTAAGDCTVWRAGEKSALLLTSPASTRASITTWTGSRTKPKVRYHLTLWRPLLPYGYSYKARVPEQGRQARGGVIKTSHFLSLNVNISKAVRDTSKVTING